MDDNGWTSQQVKEFIEAVLIEQRRGIELAEREREKAAQALASSIRSQIEAGDMALRDHVDQQVQQIRAALDALHREMNLTRDSSEKAIAKAETATEKRFESVNEWRGQSADRERSQEDQMAKLASTFLPRETADAQFDSLRQQIAKLEEKVSKLL